jgi:hypothetical protein
MESTDIGRRILAEALEIAETGAHKVPECVARRIGNVVRGMDTDTILQWSDEGDLESAIATIRVALLCMVATIRGEAANV